MTSKLAIDGGTPVIDKEFERYNPYGLEELNAAKEVIQGGVLSDFYGTNSDKFLGGEQVRRFEEEIASFYGVNYAVTFNSWTSGLVAAVGAIDPEPGDEIIVPTWTMTATAMAVIQWNCIPIFADINPNTFNICEISLENNISEKTKAIMAVDIFGLPANIKKIKEIAEKYNLKIINDSAQSPASKINGKFVGTQSDIGGFSLNYHKHFHTGEGGIIITNDENLYRRSCLIRNHGEICLNEGEEVSNILGQNFRMGEIEAAMGRQQLKKIDVLVDAKRDIAEKLTFSLGELQGIRLTEIPDGYTHSYYLFPIVLDTKNLNLDRNKIVNALLSEGVPVSAGYQNLHLLPIYQKKIAYGKSGIPWSLNQSRKDINYKKGICPVAEDYHDNSFIFLPICSYNLDEKDVDLIIEAFKKVWLNLDALN